jgi:hypothetical protein
MNRKIIAVALLGSVALAALPSQADPLTLKSVTVTLPDSTRLYEGDNSEAINNNCLACHSVGMVMNQPNMPKAGWQAVVTKMINVYKAEISQRDVPKIVDYLASIKGAN